MLGLVLVSISVSIPCIIVLVYVLQSVAMLACPRRHVRLSCCGCHAVDVLHTSSHMVQAPIARPCTATANGPVGLHIWHGESMQLGSLAASPYLFWYQSGSSNSADKTWSYVYYCVPF